MLTSPLKTDALHITGLPIHPARVQVIANASILVVDDDGIICKILSGILRTAGFHHVQTVSSGEEALKEIKRKPPDLVLLDLVMEGMSGLEVCKAVYDMEMEHPPSILMLTASQNETHLIDAFNLGAVDYITKPARNIEILMRSIAHIERRIFEIQIASDRNRMRSELDDASQLQHALLPDAEHIKDITAPLNLDVASNVTFSSEMGGDIWGMKQVGESQVCFYTVDVTGHGLRSAIHTFRVHSLIQETYSVRNIPSAMLATLNNRLHGVMPTGQFATMCYTLINLEQLTLDYSTAAAPLPIVIGRDGQYRQLEGGGLPLGCSADSMYDQYRTQLFSGDTILIYSDALTEMVPTFTEEKVVELIQKQTGSAQDVIDNLRLEALHNLGNEPIGDDLTLVVIRIP